MIVWHLDLHGKMNLNLGWKGLIALDQLPVTNFVVKQGGGVDRLAASLREGPPSLSSNVTTLLVHGEWGVALLGIAQCCTAEQEFSVLCFSVLHYSVHKYTSVYWSVLQCTEEHICVLHYSVHKYTSVYCTTVYRSTHQCTSLQCTEVHISVLHYSVKKYSSLLHPFVLQFTEVICKAVHSFAALCCTALHRNYRYCSVSCTVINSIWLYSNTLLLAVQ